MSLDKDNRLYNDPEQAPPARKRGKPSKGLTETRAVLAAAGRREGIAVSSIAKALGVRPESVVRLTKREEVRGLLQGESFQMVGAVPVARHNIITLIERFFDLEDPQLRFLAWKSSIKLLESMGLMSSGNGEPRIVNNILIQNQNVLSPVISGMLGDHMRNLLGGEASPLESANPIQVEIPAAHPASDRSETVRKLREIRDGAPEASSWAKEAEDRFEEGTGGAEEEGEG